MRKRAGALFIKDDKLLLISEGGKEMFWTPGGGLERGEDFIDALERELQEELGAALKSAESFLKFYDPEADEEVEYFLVDIDLPQKLNKGTRIHWYSKQDFDSNLIEISKRIYKVVYPELIRKGHIKQGNESLKSSRPTG